MFKQAVNKKSKISPNSNKGMALKFLLCLLFSLTALVVAGCAEDIDEEPVEQEAAVFL